MLDIERNGDVHILHLRNGENRFNRGSLDAINGALDKIEAADDPTAMVVTGEGKFFSNGLDLDWLTGDGASEVDMVINVGALKSSDYHSVEDDIRGVVR